MSNRGGPSGRALARAAKAANEAPRGGPTWAAPMPVGARYSPNTSRSAPAHSPVVPPAWASAIVAVMTLAAPSAVRRRASGAPERRCSGLGEPVHADHDLVTRFDTAGAVGQGTHESCLQRVDGRERAS